VNVPLLRSVRPQGIQIPNVSQAVVVESGRLVFLSGHVPMAEDGRVPVSLGDQLRLTFAHLKCSLAAVGASARSVARLTIYVRDLSPELLETIRQARDEFIDVSRPPASALIGVAALFHPEIRVEVDAVAVLPEFAVPFGYLEVSRLSVRVDGEPAVLTRHERRDGRNGGLGGEHFSTLISGDGKLKGSVDLSLEKAMGTLPSRQRAEQVARVFLAERAPDLLERMEITWIEPHDEFIRVVGAQGESSASLTVSGMKVKARNLVDGKWFWVIVGSDEKPMVFERDIVWLSFPGRRQTEKWLHDDWLESRGR
jgi:enamine deaminase RidA (YjgF/YER057c/UK114 family)